MKHALGTWWWDGISPNQLYPADGQTTHGVVTPNLPVYDDYSNQDNNQFLAKHALETRTDGITIAGGKGLRAQPN